MSMVYFLLAESSGDVRGETTLKWLDLIPSIITALVAVAGFAGLAKYIIEPWYIARSLRRKYATALWIACGELESHFIRVSERLDKRDPETINALKMIPDNDSKEGEYVRPDWFVKEGYYTMTTAYKIALVSAWLQIYQRELLFLPFHSNQKFLGDLYQHASDVNSAFSTDTCLWYDYVGAVGDGLVLRTKPEETAMVVAPISFAEFCERYTVDNRFRLFYEQLHMYIWFVANRDQAYAKSVTDVIGALKALRSLLKREKLLPESFGLERPPIKPELSLLTGQQPKTA
jgi:hypothetical protein